MCVEVGRVRVDEARSIANQNKALQHDFSSVIYIITIKLSLRIKKNSNKDKRIDELDIKSPRKRILAKIFFAV